VKRVALVAAHFPPSNTTNVHRARLWGRFLPEFGWHPVVVTTHWNYYEEKLDWDLAKLVPPGLEVVRTRAFPVKPLRIVGDLGVRALWWHYRALCELARDGRLDFVHITIPSNYSALLGRMVLRQTGVPYGIDYNDPWVHRWPGTEKLFSKAWISCKLGEWLEPWAVRDARLITGVAPLYFEDVLRRNPGLRDRAVTASMPHGACEEDFVQVRAMQRRLFLFDPADGHFHILYAGALLPNARVVLERLLEGLARVVRTRPEFAGRIRLHFVGPCVERFGLQSHVDEHPHRIAYADVLNHLSHASGILVLGSTEKHYTPSKVFQGALARRPMLAILHEDSTAVEMIRRSRSGTVLTLSENGLPGIDETAAAIERFVTANGYTADSVDWRVFEETSARQSARALAEALNRATGG
jgi:hypothetical protein